MFTGGAKSATTPAVFSVASAHPMAPEGHTKGTADHDTACENTIACQRTILFLNLLAF